LQLGRQHACQGTHRDVAPTAARRERAEQPEPKHGEPRQPVTPREADRKSVSQHDLRGTQQDEPAEHDYDEPRLESASYPVDSIPPAVLCDVAQCQR
jgi:hypothetical protein